MDQNSELYKDLDRVLLTREEIAVKVRELGEKITRDYAGRKPVLVCILKGAAVFFTDLIREIDLPLTLDFMAISSYGSATKTSGVVRILKDLDNDILGKDVIVVEDIVDSGITLSYLTKILVQRGAKSLRIAALLDKPARRKVQDLEVDCLNSLIPDLEMDSPNSLIPYPEVRDGQEPVNDDPEAAPGSGPVGASEHGAGETRTKGEGI